MKTKPSALTVIGARGPSAAGACFARLNTGTAALIRRSGAKPAPFRRGPFHLDADFINGAYRWYNGGSQKLNVINLGTTPTF